MRGSLTPLEDALDRLVAELPVIAGEETIDLKQACGRILVHDLTAPVAVPPADNSAMDGYAVQAGDVLTVPVTLPVSQRIPAGQGGQPLLPGTAARIFTGAPLPPGANAVVMQENTTAEGESVTIRQTVNPGDNVRARGDDIPLGMTLFAAGHRLDARDMHVLSSCGIARLTVRRRLKVAVLTTGDELVRPGSPLGPGQIYNSNFYVLSALLNGLGVEVLDFGTVGDTLSETVATLEQAAAGADCLISSGGVSVGEEDHVKAAVQQLGEISLWKLALKPGKPFAWGRVNDRPFFGLPGNPVSAFVTFVLLVRPALLKLGGADPQPPLSVSLPVAFSVSSGERQEYLRVRLTRRQGPGQQLQLCNNQSSGAGSSLSLADGLAVLPPFTIIRHGDMLMFIPFSELLG